MKWSSLFILEPSASLAVSLLLDVGEKTAAALAEHATRSAIGPFARELFDGGRFSAAPDLALVCHTASFNALWILLEETELERLAWTDTHTIPAFGANARGWVKTARRQEPRAMPSEQITEILRAALSDPESWHGHLQRARKDAESAMLARLRDGVEPMTVPEAFRRRFVGENPDLAGWFDLSRGLIEKAVGHEPVERAATPRLLVKTLERVDHLYESLATKFEHLERRLNGERPDALATESAMLRRASEEGEARAASGIAPPIQASQVDQFARDATARGVAESTADEVTAEWAGALQALWEDLAIFLEVVELPVGARDLLARAAESRQVGAVEAALCEVEDGVEYLSPGDRARLKGLRACARRTRLDYRRAASLHAEAAMLSAHAKDVGARIDYHFEWIDDLLAVGRRFNEDVASLECARLAADQLLAIVRCADRETAARVYDLCGVVMAELAGRVGGDRKLNLVDRAVHLHSEASTLAPEGSPLAGGIWHNLGMALLMRAAHCGTVIDRRRTLRQACVAFDRALKVRSREMMPAEYQQTSAALGFALQDLGRTELEAEQHADEES